MHTEDAQDTFEYGKATATIDKELMEKVNAIINGPPYSSYPTIFSTATTSYVTIPGGSNLTYNNVPGLNGPAWGLGNNSVYGGGFANSTFTSGAATNPTLSVKGDANFEGDIKWKGRSLGDLITAIENRLSILVPDPKKLEHFEALKKAYDNYKTLEALCQVPENTNEEQ